MSRTTLFSPLHLGAIVINNRQAIAPDGRRHSAEADGLPGAKMVAYYHGCSQAGLIIAEGAAISPTACGDIAMAGIHTEAQRLAWSAIADAVHAAGSRIALPLLHAGRISHRALQPGQALPLAPSSGRAHCFVSIPGERRDSVRRLCNQARAIEPREIDALVRDYREAAVNAVRAGCDLIEIEAGRGQLLHQFLSSASNQRSDLYGGPLENRARLLLRIVDTLVLQCGADRVGVNLAPEGLGATQQGPEDAAMARYLASELARRQIAYLRVSAPCWVHGPQLDLQLRADLRAGFGRPIIATGLADADSAAEQLRSSLADVVGVASGRLQRPPLAERDTTEAQHTRA